MMSIAIGAMAAGISLSNTAYDVAERLIRNEPVVRKLGLVVAGTPFTDEEGIEDARRRNVRLGIIRGDYNGDGAEDYCVFLCRPRLREFKIDPAQTCWWCFWRKGEDKGYIVTTYLVAFLSNREGPYTAKWIWRDKGMVYPVCDTFLTLDAGKIEGVPEGLNSRSDIDHARKVLRGDLIYSAHCWSTSRIFYWDSLKGSFGSLCLTD